MSVVCVWDYTQYLVVELHELHGFVNHDLIVLVVFLLDTFQSFTVQQ